MLTREQAESMVRQILCIVAHEPNHRVDSWWGMDTNCGTDAEVMGEALQILAEAGVCEPKGDQ